MVDDLVSHLGRIARDLAADPDPDAVLAAVVAAAVDDVPGAEHASISVVDIRRRVRTVVSTSRTAVDVDRLQYEHGQGPCLDTLFEHVTVRADDLATETRWPVFGAAAAAAGVASMLSAQLFTDGRNLGALNMFASGPDAFDDDSERVALALAAHAAVAVAAAEQIQGLQLAVDNRDLIGQAKGVLMERYRFDATTAFAVLVRYSRDNNIKLVQVARNVVEHGRPLP